MAPVAEREKRSVLRRGSVPLFAHGVAEYGEGLLTILAPFLFGYDGSTGATLLSIVIGASVLVLAVVTDTRTGISRTLPLAAHVVLDYVLVVVYLASPFIFGFSDVNRALGFFLVIGIAHLLMTVTTRFRQHDRHG